MAAPWHPEDMVNNSRYVAFGALPCLAGPQATGHSACGPHCWTMLSARRITAQESIRSTTRRVPTPRQPGFWRILPMPDAVKVGFVPFSSASRGVLVVFCDETLKFGPATQKALGAAAGTVRRAASTNQFKGKSGSTLDI